MLQAEGRSKDAIVGPSARLRGRGCGRCDALGAAYFVMGWAFGDLGKEGSNRVEAFAGRLPAIGQPARQARLLSNLGVACGWEGRWDEALSYYERAREECVKIGSTVDAEVARINIAEILADRGELAEAEALLLNRCPVAGFAYRYFLGACLWVLGRVSLRALRIDEALSPFRRGQGALPACRRGAGNPGRRCPSRGVPGPHGRSRRCARTGGCHAAPGPIVERNRKGRAAAGARARLCAAPAGGPCRRAAGAGGEPRFGQNAARPVRDCLTLLALIRLDRVEGVEPSAEVVTESQSLIANLKVQVIPAVPLVANQPP